MCGIAGFSLKTNLSQKENVLRIMNDKLSHRGPDGEGYYHDSNVSLSHKRLAIIDLNSRSNQPFADKSNQYLIVFNGEIYNYIELKEKFKDEYVCKTNSDIEILPFMYRKFGIDFLDYLNVPHYEL